MTSTGWIVTVVTSLIALLTVGEVILFLDGMFGEGLNLIAGMVVTSILSIISWRMFWKDIGLTKPLV